ncbi:MAG: nucleotide sugar dehydrogenase [Bdellovibrionales bacterium]|nr:nucleotide sugar dehydrogenase [Bdellovibrionales bacterium]
MSEAIGVVGLGYVGLALTLGLARKFEKVVGYDKNPRRVEELANGMDSNGEYLRDELSNSRAHFTAELESLRDCSFIIIGVPTPVDRNNKPDLEPLRSASMNVGKVLSAGTVVVYESTVYPGVTEEFCGPILESQSGLKSGKDFFLGYSPERINPGDKQRTLDKIVKIISAQDTATLSRLEKVYGEVIEAGLYKASSIQVAEAAKVIENTQRDLNIALMNELAIIFDRMNLDTREVIDAAASKWNFANFRPGLVGGHCIGVDPYYLTSKAEQLGYIPQVILAGRRINDDMGVFVAQRLVKAMAQAGLQLLGARVGVLGLAFKENVSDARNSRVPSLVSELETFGIEVLLHDPLVDPQVAREEYDLELRKWEELDRLQALVLCVSHEFYTSLPITKLISGVNSGGVIADVKAVIDPREIPDSFKFWRL